MTDITELKGIGEKTAKLYRKLGIDTVEDAVFYFPRDYVTYEPVSSAANIRNGDIIAIKATVAARPVSKKIRRLSITSVMLGAQDTAISATWFNMPYLPQILKPQSTHVFRGKITSEGDHYHMEQPHIYSEEEYEELLGHINPVYPLTKGLSNNAMVKTVRRSFEQLEGVYDHEIYDMHFPKDEETLRAARQKLVYDEFLSFILKLRLLKTDGEQAHNDFNIIEVAQCERIIEKLPYRLTGAQMRVWGEVKRDLCSHTSMRRLIQGDVGSGKTIIATLAAVMTALNHHQCAIMAPTEILANQHYLSIKKLLADNGISLNVVLMTGSMSASSKKSVRTIIENGEADIIIGTHALFFEKVIYKDLALVVTDEQHRFGVAQRSMLAAKNTENEAHVLVMSATPIPRTLAIIMYGDLSISLIDELPAHKKPIKNAVVGEDYRSRAYDFMKKEIEKGHQIYVICPMIEESEGLDAKNVTDTAQFMRSVFDDTVKIGILHGKMKNDEKQRVMDDFANNFINILVSTTVVEVGINVPNATVMMIENADRFGLAALHQLRGRIGRGADQSYCIFMSASTDPDSIKRLEILKKSNDGFVIAEEDLRLRGPGDMFGFRQSGDIRFRLGDIYTDAAILKKASDDADAILKKDPGLKLSEHEHLLKRIYDEKEVFLGSTL